MTYPQPTNHGNIDPTLAYASPGIGYVSPRPGVVTSLAIIGIVMGGSFLLCSVAGTITNSLMLANGGRNMLVPNAPPVNPAITKLGIAESIIGIVLWIMLLVGAILALRLKPAGRRIIMFWSVLMIVMVIIRTAAQLIWVMPATKTMIQKMQPGGGMPNGFVVGSLIAGVIFNLIFYLALPVLYLTLWKSPRVKHAFATGFPPRS